MNSLKEIYVAYEIGEIYPENLPKVLLDFLGETNGNEALQKIVALKKPTRGDIYEFICEAFEISKEEKLAKLETLDLLINRWLNNKISAVDLENRMDFFELKDVYYSESYERFMTNLHLTACGDWVPSDEWDFTIENLEKDFKIENRYAEFLLDIHD